MKCKGGALFVAWFLIAVITVFVGRAMDKKTKDLIFFASIVFPILWLITWIPFIVVYIKLITQREPVERI